MFTGTRLQSRPRRLAILAGLGLCLTGSSARAGGEIAAAEQLKAAFVMNFVKFVEWPGRRVRPDAGPIAIAVLGDPRFGGTLVRAAADRKPGGRAVTVRMASSIDEVRTAQMVFIGRDEQRRLPAILRALEDQPVLTVGDTHGFAEAGVVLNLYTFDQRVRIEVNTTAAARAQLRLSAHLLRIARIVG